MSSDTPSKDSVTIKKYANRRLYNTATSTYVTLENLAQMVKENTEFNVYDAKTGEDITRSVLTQIIVEEEGKSGQNLLPISFLRQLIGFYGDNMQWMVPKYLEQTMQSFTKNQEQFRGYFQSSFPGMFPFGTTLEEMGKQNMAMFERAMRLFSPFAPGAEGGEQSAAPAASFTPAPAPAAQNSAPTAAPESDEDRTEPGIEIPTFTLKSKTAAAEPAPTPVAPAPADTKGDTPAPMRYRPEASSSASPATAEDVQQKIANLQKQLAELAKNRG